MCRSEANFTAAGGLYEPSFFALWKFSICHEPETANRISIGAQKAPR